MLDGLLMSLQIELTVSKIEAAVNVQGPVKEPKRLRQFFVLHQAIADLYTLTQLPYFL